MDQSDSVPDPGAEEAASPLPTRSRLVQESRVIDSLCRISPKLAIFSVNFKKQNYRELNSLQFESIFAVENFASFRDILV